MPSKPKAHFNFSRGRSAAVTPPCGAKREFEASLPQLIHEGPRVGSVVGVEPVHRFGAWVAAAETAGARPVKNCATAARSATESPAPCALIFPIVSVLTIASVV